MTDIKVFSKEWFKKYSKAITWVARLPILGELIFNFKKYGHYVDRKKVCEVTPNSVVEYLGMKGKKAELRQHFFVRNEYALRLQEVFYPIWITFHIWDIITRPIPQLNLGFDTLEKNPAAGENSPVDGYVYHVQANQTWATIRNGAGTSAFSTDTGADFIGVVAGANSNTWSNIIRSIFLFDTSTLTSGATISAAVMSLYGYKKYDTFNVPAAVDVDIYTSTPNSNSVLVAGDFTQIGTTSQTGSPITYDNFSITGYNAFTLNATGKGNISKTGISKFGARNANHDVANSAPTYSASAYSTLRCYFADNATNKPKLVVTYTSVVAPTVTTQAVSNIAKTTATGNGNITATGGANCTRRGFCYKAGTSGDPTVADSTAYDDGSFGTGAFTKSITGLTAGTSYRVRAYAVNSAGTSYGATVSVTTLKAFIPRTTWF
jgi:hypothetical protein